MNRFCLVVFSGCVLAACGAMDIMLEVPDRQSRSASSMHVVPVSYDGNGHSFRQLHGGRIGIDAGTRRLSEGMSSEIAAAGSHEQNPRSVPEFDALAKPGDRHTQEQSRPAEQ